LGDLCRFPSRSIRTASRALHRLGALVLVVGVVLVLGAAPAFASTVPTSSLDASRVLAVPGSEVAVTGAVTLSTETVSALADAFAAASAGTQTVSVVGTMPVSVSDVGGIPASTPLVIAALVGGWVVGRFALG